MSRRPTRDQQIVLDRISSGRPVLAKDYAGWDGRPLPVLTVDWRIDGTDMVAHRTVRDHAGHERTEMFRVAVDGRAQGV